MMKGYTSEYIYVYILDSKGAYRNIFGIESRSEKIIEGVYLKW